MAVPPADDPGDAVCSGLRGDLAPGERAEVELGHGDHSSEEGHGLFGWREGCASAFRAIGVETMPDSEIFMSMGINSLADTS